MSNHLWIKENNGDEVFLVDEEEVARIPAEVIESPLSYHFLNVIITNLKKNIEKEYLNTKT